MGDSALYDKMIKISEVQTLLKYDLPQIVSKVEPPKHNFIIPFDIFAQPTAIGANSPTIVETGCALKRQENEEFLDYLLPPREWVDGYNRVWRQRVSTSPATRFDVIHLEKNLDIQLLESGALPVGICPIRREVYSQCFDEILRQATVNCAERGLLLLRIRNECLLTMKSLSDGYVSALAYAINKVLLGYSREWDLYCELEDLTKEQQRAERELTEVEGKHEHAEMALDDEKEDEVRSHNEEMEIQKRINEQLKQKLLRVIDPGVRRGGFF